MKQIYFSIRVVEATSEAKAVQKVQNEIFNESHPLSDKVLTHNELQRFLNGQKPRQNYVVEVPNIKMKKTTNVNGLLATSHVKGKTLICIYSRGEAIKKARLFGGKAKRFDEPINNKKHYNINY